MKRSQQRQILDLINTINDAQSAGYYADAQEGISAICSFIDEIEGPGSDTVELLKDHFVLLFKAGKGEASDKILRKHLIKIEKSIQSEFVPNKIEIAFISYNASMSDSMLSIYKAAKAAPGYDAVWLPVPFFDKNADGTFGTMHYEGAECYENIECTDWQKYDIEARHPDIIITFSPYDGNNYVTSVHPDFYCERLCKLTELLVYMPYFVLTGDVPEHFVTVPGCIYAHKVIVQSEKIRKDYIRIFKKNYGNKFGRPEDKFISIGSPKFDAVVSAQRKDYKIPDNWRKLLKNKKAVFYNTSVTSLLEGNEQYLKKLRSVLCTCKECKDVTLWWRPHPLLEATCKSMRPQLFNEYKQIVQEYKQEGWGIYDDSTELHRAIAWTDAYYGDESSLVELFKISNKDVLLQNILCAVGEDVYNRIRFLDFLDDEEVIWFSSFDTNGLYRYIKSENRTEFAASFQTNTVSERYRAICKVGQKLYFAPIFAESIAIYDIKLNSMQYVSIEPKTECRRKYVRSAAKFIEAHCFGKFIFFTPLAFDAIIRYDTETGQVDYFSDYIEELGKLAFDKEAYWFRSSITVDERIYLPSACANALVEFDMLHCKSMVHKLGSTRTAYQSICHDGKNFWLMHSSGDAVSAWHKETGIVAVVPFAHKSRYNCLLSFQGGILRIPCKGDLTCDFIYLQNNYPVVNIQLKLPKKSASGLERALQDNDSVLCGKILDEKICIYSTLYDAVYTFNLSGDMINEFYTSVMENGCINKQDKQMLQQMIDSETGCIYKREDFISLKLPDYLRYVSQLQTKADKCTANQFNGQTIFDYIRSCLS